MRATITVYGEQGSGKTRWLEQLKRTLLATTPAEAVEVTVHETHRKPGTSFYVGEQFDEFTIPAADAVGTASPAGDRETWSVTKRPTGWYSVLAGSRAIGSFAHRSDAELFKKLKCTSSGQWQALGGVLEGRCFYYGGSRPLFTGEPITQNCKGGGGEIAEGAGVIPPGVYWHDTAGNFFNYWTDRSMGGSFYTAWARRKSEFPQSRHAVRMLNNGQFGKLSAAEAPAIHDEWPTPMVPRAERDQLVEKYATVSDKYSDAVDRIQELLSAHQVIRRDAVELREERDEARRERDALKERFANVRAFLNGFKDLSDALRDAADIARAS